MNPYSPYSNLSEVLAAAGIEVRDLGLYSTQSLLVLARERSDLIAKAASAEAKPTKAGKVPEKPERVPMVTRSARITYDLDTAVEEKARGMGTNGSAVIAMLLKQWVEN